MTTQTNIPDAEDFFDSNYLRRCGLSDYEEITERLSEFREAEDLNRAGSYSYYIYRIDIPDVYIYVERDEDFMLSGVVDELTTQNAVSVGFINRAIKEIIMRLILRNSGDRWVSESDIITELRRRFSVPIQPPRPPVVNRSVHQTYKSSQNTGVANVRVVKSPGSDILQRFIKNEEHKIKNGFYGYNNRGMSLQTIMNRVMWVYSADTMESTITEEKLIELCINVLDRINQTTGRV